MRLTSLSLTALCPWSPFKFVSVCFCCIKWSDECKGLLVKPVAGSSLSPGLTAPRSLCKLIDSTLLELCLVWLWLVDTGPEALFPHSCHNMMWSTLACPSESAQDPYAGLTTVLSAEKNPGLHGSQAERESVTWQDCKTDKWCSGKC